MKILFIEDNAVYAKIVLEVILTGPEQVDHVTSMSAALLLLKSVTPDVILLDLSLPDAEWPESLEMMVKAYPDFPIVCLSAEPSRVKEAIKLGADDYLDKAKIRREEALEALEKAVERRKRPATLLKIKRHFEKLQKDLANESRGKETS